MLSLFSGNGTTGTEERKIKITFNDIFFGPATLGIALESYSVLSRIVYILNCS
jgi:hypothetical protein